MQRIYALLALVLTAQFAISQTNNRSYFHISKAISKNATPEIINLRGAEYNDFDAPSFLKAHANHTVRIIGRNSDAQNLIAYDFDSNNFEYDEDCPAFCEKLVKLERVPFMGVAVNGMEDFSGVKIVDIIEGSAAENTDLMIGDIITDIQTVETSNPCELRLAVNEQNADEWVNVTYARGGSNYQTLIKMGYKIRKHITWVNCCSELENDETEELSNQYIALDVFPNPTKGVTQFQFQTSSYEQATFTLVDLNGKLILKNEIFPIDGLYNDYLDLGNLASGIYVLHVTQAKETLSKKIILQKK